MRNKTNQVLVDTIQAERSLFFKFALKQCRNSEIAEDLIQSTLCKFLSIPIKSNVKSPKRFICATILQMYQNYRTVNRKYVVVGDLHGTEDKHFVEKIFNKVPCSYEGDLMDSFTLKEVRKAAQSLPLLQKAQIMASLAGEELGESLGKKKSSKARYESLKTHRRLAILKLKERFK